MNSVDAHAPGLSLSLDATGAVFPQPRSNDGKRYACSLALAATAHAMILTAILPSKAEQVGENGSALEAIAVSILDTTQVISAPQAVPVTVGPEATAANTEPKEEANEQPKPEEQAPQPHEQKQALALDLPPEPVPLPEAPTLPTREPDAAPARETMTKTETKLDEKKIEKTKTDPSASASAGGAPALPTQSRAEAAPAVVRAYATTISKLLDRHKPGVRGLRGEVVINFVIDPGGRTAEPVISHSSGNRQLDQIVMAALQRIEFPPPPQELNLNQRTFVAPFQFR